MLNRNVVLLSLAAALALAGGLRAQTREGAAGRFTFTAGKEAGERLTLVLHRWSTDQERDRVFAAAQTDPSKAFEALDNPGVVGYIHLPGGLDHTIRYARRVPRSDGSADIVLIAERPVWLWWQPAASDGKTSYTYTAIQFHVNASGAGEGKLSSTSVVADKDAGVVLANYRNEPALLMNVKAEQAS